jgi:Peptidase_C39 like family/Tetratricopeptide repeat
MRKILLASLLGLLGICLVSVVFYNLPPVHERASYRIEEILTNIRHEINPPEAVVFVPQGAPQKTLDAAVQGTLQALQPTGIATSIPVITVEAPATPTNTPAILPTSTPVPTPLPEKVELKGIRHEWQQMNNCGPTTLAMALSFWGWKGDQTDTRAYLRPNFRTVDDKNVSPVEMVDYVQSQTGLKAITRVGGDLELVKSLLAAGFPVVIEKGLQPAPGDWMGHYVLVSGYNDASAKLTTQDSYTGPGEDVEVPYKDLQGAWWRDFDYVYLVIYPPEREGELLALLGPRADEGASYQYAAQVAEQETKSLKGRDLFFAWYNLGTNLVALGNYAQAAQAYDQAFALYPAIPEADRPWRMLWYQVGPYEAYFQTGRYQDVIDLGNQTLANLGKPILEETLYWLGRAREAQGELDKAIFDYRRAYAINPTSTPAGVELERLGVEY